MQSEMSRLDDPEVRASNPFWADGARARSFALLRLRVERVPVALEYCRRVLGGIHAQFYCLEVVPSKLEMLCRFFAQPSELHRVMAKSHKTCMEQAEIIDTFGTYHQSLSYSNFYPLHEVHENRNYVYNFYPHDGGHSSSLGETENFGAKMS